MRRIEYVNKGNLRDLCIERDWFTSGTNDHYSRLFTMARDYDQHSNETDRLYKLQAMARLIVQCSTPEALGGFTVDVMMSAIQRECISICYIDEEA